MYTYTYVYECTLGYMYIFTQALKHRASRLPSAKRKDSAALSETHTDGQGEKFYKECCLLEFLIQALLEMTFEKYFMR